MTWLFIMIAAFSIAGLIYLFIKWRGYEIEKEETLKRKNVEFQLENLKTQINPHFLFNSFNTLATLIEEDQRLAITYVENLSDFYRHTLKYKDTNLISLREEIELTESYVFLLKQRHGNNLKITIEIGEHDLNHWIPPLTLQLLIENAVKHNVVSRQYPLRIEIFMSAEHQLSIRNNLQPREEEVVSTQMGLKNVSARFEILEGERVEIVTTEKYFQVNLPLLKNLPA